MTSRSPTPTSPAIVRREVTTCVHRTLADLLGVDESILEPDLSLADDLAVDSMELLEVALSLEDAFDVAVPQRRLDGVRTCGQLVDLVLSLVTRRAATPGTPALRPVSGPARDPWSGCCYAA